MDITFEDIKKNAGNHLQCKAFNPLHEGIVPPPLVISQSVETPEHENELVFLITNTSEEDIHLTSWQNKVDIPVMSLENEAYISIDFSDFIDLGLQSYCEFTAHAEGLYPEFVLISKAAESLGLFRKMDTTTQKEKGLWVLRNMLAESRIAELNMAIVDETIQLTTTQDEEALHTIMKQIERYTQELYGFTLKSGASLTITAKFLVTTFRPGLRYVDITWKNAHRVIGFFQNTIELKRPSYYVQPPFPLHVYWLDNHNVVYTSTPGLEIDNELSFGISNKGLNPLKLDCRENLVDSPYFELIFLGGKGTGDITEVQHLKDIQLELLDESYGDKWTHHKMIQGPVVTWRIEPILYDESGYRNTSILGIEEHGTITFTLKNLKVFGKNGVSMIYLKYYNIPDFDNNQIILMVEKKPATGSIPEAGFKKTYLSIDGKDKTNTGITPPLRWKLEKGLDGKPLTTVVLGDKIGIGINNPAQSLEVKGTIKASEINTSGKISSKELVAENINATQWFVGNGAVVKGMIVMWSGYATNVPVGWAICNGQNGTPNLNRRFVFGAGNDGEVNRYDGEEQTILYTNHLPSHNHTMSHNHALHDPGHTHGFVGYHGVGSAAGNSKEAISARNGVVDYDPPGKMGRIYNANTGMWIDQFNGSTGAVGSNQPHNNMPPYCGLYFIMKL
jgi:microcystin-dependent protein